MMSMNEVGRKTLGGHDVDAGMVLIRHLRVGHDRPVSLQ